MSRFMYWPPWHCTRPWWFAAWVGTDEWHNHAVSLKLPFLGAFHFFYEPHMSREGEGHWRSVSGCACCALMDTEEAADPAVLPHDTLPVSRNEEADHA